jgi:hypothetical protein
MCLYGRGVRKLALTSICGQTNSTCYHGQAKIRLICDCHVDLVFNIQNAMYESHVISTLYLKNNKLPHPEIQNELRTFPLTQQTYFSTLLK